MATAAEKRVRQSILDTWTQGDSLPELLSRHSGGMSDLSDLLTGDQAELPYMDGFTVHSSETAAVSSSPISVDVLTLNDDLFINQELTHQQNNQLMGGNGAFGDALAKRAAASMGQRIDRLMLEYIYKAAAWDAGATPAYHYNLAADDLVQGDVDDAEASVREQDGIANTGAGLVWIASPRAHKSVKTMDNFMPLQARQAEGAIGIPQIGELNGLPFYVHNGLPGRVDASRHYADTSAVTIASNVATATVPAGHGFVQGQLIYTTGLTTNVAKASPVAINSVTATTVVFDLTAADGALADGVGQILSASSYLALVYAPWVSFAFEKPVPFSEMVKREGNAGWAVQLFNRMGRAHHAGAAAILHGPD